MHDGTSCLLLMLLLMLLLLLMMMFVLLLVGPMLLLLLVHLYQDMELIEARPTESSKWKLQLEAFWKLLSMKISTKHGLLFSCVLKQMETISRLSCLFYCAV